MLLCTATLLLTNGTVFGQKEWALQECVDYALQHNLNVKQSYLNTNQAANQVLHNKLDSLLQASKHILFYFNTLLCLNQFYKEFDCIISGLYDIYIFYYYIAINNRFYSAVISFP